MIYDKDRLDPAFAKVCLFADPTWLRKEDAYFRANKELWLRICLAREFPEGICQPRSVSDTIPGSRLAGYGTYLYDEMRESMYMPSHSYLTPIGKKGLELGPFQSYDECWMRPELDEFYAILTDPTIRTDEIEKRCFQLLHGDTDVSELDIAIQPVLTELSDETLEALEISNRYVPETPKRNLAITSSELVLQTKLHSEDVRALWTSDNFSDEFVTTEEKSPSDGFEQYLAVGYPRRFADFQSLDSLITDIQSLHRQIPERKPLSAGFPPLPLLLGFASSPEPLLSPLLPGLPLSPLFPGLPTSPVRSSPPVQHLFQHQMGAVREQPRRLYSAVLQNQTADEMDELEREALEQYRPSIGNLTKGSHDSIMSAKFQELERLAMEQYSGSSISTENYCPFGPNANVANNCGIIATGNGTLPLHELRCGGKFGLPYAAHVAQSPLAAQSAQSAQMAHSALMLANAVLAAFYRSLAAARILSYFNTGFH